MAWDYCKRCKQRASWGRSPLCVPCLSGIGLLVTTEGEPIAVSTITIPTGQGLLPARYRYRGVRCGQRFCRSCPHEWYVYRQWRAGGRLRERYLGPAKEARSCFEAPVFRAPKNSVFGRRRG